MGKVIAVTSGKGGTGKSTFCVGLSAALSKLEKKVLLIDMDEGLRCLDLLLGVDNEIVFDLGDILSGRPYTDAVYTLEKNENISLIPAPLKPDTVKSEDLSKLLGELIPAYDYLILDFPAGIDFRLYEILPHQTQIIAVCCPDPVSVRDASAVCAMLPKKSKPAIFVLNRFILEDIKSGIFDNIDDIIDKSGFRLLGIIPESEELTFLAARRKLKPKGRPFAAFSRIARRLDGEHIRLPKPKKI